MLNTYLKHLNIVALSSVLAGPLVGSFFAELGSKVIKIENPKSGGDVTRGWKLPAEDQDDKASAYYDSANFNKEVLFLDLSSHEGYTQLMDILSSADIVISNFQKRVAQKLKVDHETIRSNFEQVIFAQLNAFDYEDSRPGFDMVMQAEAGYISMCGSNPDSLAKIPVALMDVIASHQLKEGILLALLQREIEGKGGLVEVSLYQSAISGLVNQASNYLNAGHIAKPIGTCHPNIAPYGDLLYTQDGRALLLAVGSDLQWRKLCDALNLTHAAQEFEANSYRVKHRHRMMALLNEVSRSIGSEELEALLSNKGIPYGRINKMNEVFDSEEARSMVRTNNRGRKYISSIAFELS